MGGVRVEIEGQQGRQHTSLRISFNKHYYYGAFSFPKNSGQGSESVAVSSSAMVRDRQTPAVPLELPPLNCTPGFDMRM